VDDGVGAAIILSKYLYGGRFTPKTMYPPATDNVSPSCKISLLKGLPAQSCWGSWLSTKTQIVSHAVSIWTFNAKAQQSLTAVAATGGTHQWQLHLIN